MSNNTIIFNKVNIIFNMSKIKCFMLYIYFLTWQPTSEPSRLFRISSVIRNYPYKKYIDI